MIAGAPPAALVVLDDAVAWSRGCLELARGRATTLSTPCARWDLGQLLRHLDDAVVALAEAAELGQVSVDPLPRRAGAGSLVDRVVQRAGPMRAAWQHRITSAPVGVGDLALGTDTVVLVGALELTVHGWDIARACGATPKIPDGLATRLHPVATAVVTTGERGRRFAPALPVPVGAGSADRLLAHLGRDPAAPG